MSNVITLPECAPLYSPPAYDYRAFRKISVFVRTDKAALAAMLPRELTLTSDVIEVFIMKVPDAGSLGSYLEGGITAQVRYGDHSGGHVLYEYVTSDDSMAVGREVWGYPKKMGEVAWSETPQRLAASLYRRGSKLIDIAFEVGEAKAFDKPQLHPRLQVKKIPSAVGPGFDVNSVILNDLAAGVVHERRTGTARVELAGNAQDPLHLLPVEAVVGAELIVADFKLDYATAVLRAP